MDGEDAVEEGYIMKGQSIREGGQEKEGESDKEEYIERERGTILFLR